MDFPKVFIVILNYNGQEVIKKCLTSVFKLDYQNLEVVVVDNDSNDGSLELAKSGFSKAHFIKNEANLGFAAGNNIGIRFALERMARYVLLLNNDTEVEKDFLSRLIEVAEMDPKVGLASPVIFNGYNKHVWFSGGKIDWLKMKARHITEITAVDFYETGFISGCALLVRSDVFKKIGLLDEDYFLYWEDVDFSLRAKKAGFKNAVVASSWVYHFEKSESDKKSKIYWLVVSGLIFFQKNTPFFWQPWIWSYIKMRKIKNFLDIKLTRNELAPTVKKAYQDFKNAKP
jgi:GT2 family glycosyltransferase